MATELKLNLGSGTRYRPDFVNFDNSPSVIASRVPGLRQLLYRMRVISKHQLEADWSGVQYRDLTRGLPYPSESVSKIYSSHFLEHLSAMQGKRVLKECFRVLKPNGRFRLVVPDLLYHAKRYVDRAEKLIAQKHVRTEHRDEFLHTVAGHYLTSSRNGREHCFMYDRPSLVRLLCEIGFQQITEWEAGHGEDAELYGLDCRPEESLHLEMRK